MNELVQFGQNSHYKIRGDRKKEFHMSAASTSRKSPENMIRIT